MTNKKPLVGKSGREYDAEELRAIMKRLPGYREDVLKRADDVAEFVRNLDADRAAYQDELFALVAEEALADESFRIRILAKMEDLGEGSKGRHASPDQQGVLDLIVRTMDGITPPLPYAQIVGAIADALGISESRAKKLLAETRKRHAKP